MDWRDFVRSYFDAVHKSWLDGNEQRLLPYYSDPVQGTESERERLQRGHRLLTERGGEIYSSRGRVVPLCWMETEQALDILLSWHGTRRYGMGAQEWTEASRRIHRLRLNKEMDSWKIAAHEEWEGDRKQPFDAQQNAEDAMSSMVDNAISQPMLVVHGAGGYNAENAVAYAERYWNSPNPAYPHFNDDCTNFISQCLYAGGIPMLFSKEKGKGWWIRTGKGSEWSYSWSVAHALYLMLKSGASPMRAVTKTSPDQLVPGDIICYDFDGDGRFQHNTIVVAKDANDMPLVNAHTTDSSMRYWAYEDSTAYTPNMRYAFFHIRGV
ncbi:amidase domain-containing protein [Brevibacillus choshinensis]|uniref:Amidase domain-containing protein n=1 Tax=Brevibacillus choshinensis TaxID=54911 RepID=A0ABX7FS69_BRECH|nr:amidase domain-containing protein [Brevibacillus choshinensis]QRG68549.1 amidase domain-containing protein [Brevibacillus choshinensis]